MARARDFLARSLLLDGMLRLHSRMCFLLLDTQVAMALAGFNYSNLKHAATDPKIW